MNYINFCAATRNHISTPIELSSLSADTSPATPGPMTAAGAHLHRRYWVPASIADLVASLAGLGIREVRQ